MNMKPPYTTAVLRSYTVVVQRPKMYATLDINKW